MTVEEKIRTIDSQSSAIVHVLQKTVQPLARATIRLLDESGHKRGHILKRRREFQSEHLRITRRDGILGGDDVEVYYQGRLVFRFDHMLFYLDVIEPKRTYLYVYRTGPWEQLIVDEYRRMRLVVLAEDYGVDAEYCKWFDLDNGVCSKYEDRACPCADYAREG